MTKTPISLGALYDGDDVTISFELFPPKKPEDQVALAENVRRLMDFDPAYFTCTYGAGGSTRDTTLDVLAEVKRVTGMPVASHLTCVGSTVDELDSYLNEAADAGTDFIVALRGDPPKGEDKFTAVDGGLSYANELVDLIRQRHPHYGIAVAGYPETHQEATDAASDLRNLKRKVDAGADIVITQLFYDNDDFYRFRDDCQRVGIDIPIVPGVLPVTNFAQAGRIAKMCKARIPDKMRVAMEGCRDRGDEFAVGIEHARDQINDLTIQGVPGIHYYILNRSDAAIALLEGPDSVARQ